MIGEEHGYGCGAHGQTIGSRKRAIVYRRTEEEMPARVEEIKHAKEEGIEFYTLHNPFVTRG